MLSLVLIIIRFRQVVRPHRLPCILKVYLSIRLLHLRGCDTQAGSMGTCNPDIQIMGPPSKIGNNVTDLSCGYIEIASCSSLSQWRHFRHGHYLLNAAPDSPPLAFFQPVVTHVLQPLHHRCSIFASVLFDG